eukprot:398840_1
MNYYNICQTKFESIQHFLKYRTQLIVSVKKHIRENIMKVTKRKMKETIENEPDNNQTDDRKETNEIIEHKNIIWTKLCDQLSKDELFDEYKSKKIAAELNKVKEFRSQQIYHLQIDNCNRFLCSIDQITANYQSLKWLDYAIVDKWKDWLTFFSKFTSYNCFLNSKKIRQIIFGTVDSLTQIQRKIETFMNNLLFNMMKS